MLNLRSVSGILVFAFACSIAAHGQTIQAPAAQRMVDALLAKHPEMQTIGLHTTAPGQTQSTNIACSKPGKIGKVSADIDMGVFSSGKPYLRHTPKGAIDMGLPLADRSGNPVGMVVIVLRSTFTSDDATAIRQATLIRDELQQLIPNAGALYEGATISKTPLYLIAQTPMPEVRGGFDHLAVDQVHDRVYAAAEDNHSIEVFNLAGDFIKSVTGVKTPHSIVYDAPSNRLFVTDGDQNACIVLDGSDQRVVGKIPLSSPADTSFYDAASRRLFLGLSGKSAGKTKSQVSIISVDTQKEIRQIPVDAADLEGMALDAAVDTLYVNLRDKNQIARISLAPGGRTDVWTVFGMTMNTSMAFSASEHRLFVAGRKPGRLFVLNTEDGKLLQTLESVEGADDLSFDASHHRLYVSGVGGIGIYELQADGQYGLDASFPNHGGKTSLLVTSLGQLYSVYPATAEDTAGLLVYKRMP